MARRQEAQRRGGEEEEVGGATAATCWREGCRGLGWVALVKREREERDMEIERRDEEDEEQSKLGLFEHNLTVKAL